TVLLAIMTSALARVASRSVLRRCTAASNLTKHSYSTSPVAFAGHASSLPSLAFPESEKLVEQYDAIWDDGVAPEVTLDFDCQHISSGEGLVRIERNVLGGLEGWVSLPRCLPESHQSRSKNPAVNRRMNAVEEPMELGGWKN
ncbi:hypothetical protein HJC23_010418, partial [Cyclotella cryptica]